MTGNTGAPGASGAAAARDLVAKVLAFRSAVVNVKCRAPTAGHGSGTKTTNGLIVTAFHVVDGCTSAEYYAEGKLVGAGGMYAAPVLGRDLAVISSINWTPDGGAIPGVAAYDNVKPTIGDATVLASYPADVEADIQFAWGLVTDDDVTTSLPGDFQTKWSGAFTTDSAGAQGSSGGPMFDKDGRWVGILVGQWGANGNTDVDLRILIPLKFK